MTRNQAKALIDAKVTAFMRESGGGEGAYISVNPDPDFKWTKEKAEKAADELIEWYRKRSKKKPSPVEKSK